MAGTRTGAKARGQNASAKIWIEPRAWPRHRRGLLAMRGALLASPSVLVLATRWAATGSSRDGKRMLTRSDLSTSAGQAPLRVPRLSRSAAPRAPLWLLRQQPNGARRSQRRRTWSRGILELIAFAGPSMPPVAPPFILGWQE